MLILPSNGASSAASQTKNIRFTSAVPVLFSAVIQDFSTLDGVSNGRAEIMVGRGSFIGAFPLFGYDYKITMNYLRNI